MPRQQVNPVGLLAGTLANRAIQGAIGLPFMPSFYNSGYSNPVQGFQNSQAAQLAHGNPAAWTNYGLNTLGTAVGGAVGGPIGAFAGPHIVSLLRGRGWSGEGDGQGSVFGQGGLLSGMFNHHTNKNPEDALYYDTPDTTVGPQNYRTPGGRERISAGYATLGYMPAFNNGGASWGFATSSNPYAATYGGTGGAMVGQQPFATTLGGAVRTLAE